ncbi:MAG: hypothetical protein EOQ44_25175 [Mesorhizobium sp.]|uniref:hypothetical protein n=1 Tax=Mesorhizobium sp. TaxID=1871066 RepID=UPI000FE7C96E|nr:hypothetical protein [Mesorhizobium sp.]RWB40438.1 MAG: hypothetical protein EOQ44_25175 [Mesorhizobium sp.]
MTCVCYGADTYEGCTQPLKICATVDEAKAWWAEQHRLLHQQESSQGWHDIFCIAEFADTGVVYYYERQGNRLARGHTKEWRISETKEPT